MAFPSGWGRKQKITIDNTKVSGSADLTDFPMLITLDHLDSEITGVGANSALDGGGDIRFSSDSAGQTQLACEIVEFVTDATPANQKCEIWVKIPTLSYSADTDIYIWYNKAGETQPAVTDTFGRNAVWGDYEAVLHLNETSGPWTDSTGNGHNASLTSGTAISSVSTGHPFNGRWLDFTGSEALTLANSNSMLDSSPMMMSCWINPDFLGVSQGVLGNRHSSPDTHWFQIQSSGRFFVKRTGAEDIYEATTSGTGNTQYWVATHNSSALKAYIDGALEGSDTTIQNTAGIVGGNDYRIGTYYDGSSFVNARIGEVRARKSVLTDDWFASEYNSQSAPATFATAGTPEMAVDPSSDQHWDNVVLLTRFNDSLSDSSTSAHTASADGGETLVTSLNNTGKFGEAAQFVSDQVLYYKDTPSDFQFGTGDFTVEAWIKQSSSKAVNPVIGSYNYNRAGGGAGNWLLYVGSDRLILAAGATGSASTLLQGATANVSASDWVHVAVSRQGTSLKLFVDGSEVGELTSNSTDFNDAGGITIGNYFDSGNTQFEGFIDEVRVTKGVARYTGTFTAPATQFPEGGDEYWNNVTLLLHADEASAPYIDSSLYGHAVSNNGVTTSDTIKKFGDRSFTLSSLSTYLNVPNSDGFFFGTAPFTIEFWFYPTGAGSISPLIATASGGGSDSWLIRYNYLGTRNIVFYTYAYSDSTPYLNSTTTQLTENEWNHVAITRDNSDNMRLFINGVLANEQLNQVRNITNNNAYPLAIGKQHTYSSAYTQGNMDEIRITKGVARYTANFTPPTEAFSSTGSSGGSSGTGGDTVYWNDVANKPSTFPPSSHDHDDRYYTETEVDTLLGNKSNTSHTHDDRYYTEAEVDTLLATKASSTHNHDSDYVNVTGDSMSGALAIDNVTDSSSTTTGSLQTDGGLGVVKDVNVGGDVTVSGDVVKSSQGTYVHHKNSSNSSGGITVSTSAPSGGTNGDIWMEVD